jgi:tight adherence protein B
MRFLAALVGAVAVAATVAALTGIKVPLPKPPRRPRTPAWAVAARREGIAPTRLLGASLAAVTVTWLLVAAFTGSALVALVPAVGVGLIPGAYVRSRAQRRHNERLAAWPDALRSLVSALQAGTSLHLALVELGRTGPVALRGVWVRYQRLTDHGLSEGRALEVLRSELADPLSDRICEVLVIATAKGSRIALRVLRDVADAAAADVQLAERLRTAALEQQLSARAVFALPWVVLILVCGRAGPFRDFYAGGDGAGVLLLAAVMSTAGMLMVRRLSRMPTEPRVLLDRQEVTA